MLTRLVEIEVDYFAEALKGRGVCSDLGTKRYDKGFPIHSANGMATATAYASTTV